MRFLRMVGVFGAWTTLQILTAQQPIAFLYFYDDLNQLVRVVDSTGVNVQYVYDPVGNMIEISRTAIAPGALTLFNVTPAQVSTGGTLTIQGQGFDSNTANDLVTINGVAVTVLSASATTLVVSIPFSAASGVVSVAVNGVTANYPTPETVFPVPILTSIYPKAALPGTTVPNVVVTGANLIEASFAFQSGINVASASVDATGTAATLSITLSPLAITGRYTLLATKAGGTSTPFPVWAVNSLAVAGPPDGDADNDGLPNALEITLGTDPLNPDTDSDGFSDGVEVASNSDPLNPVSTPITGSTGGEAEGVYFSLINMAGSSGTPTESETARMLSVTVPFRAPDTQVALL